MTSQLFGHQETLQQLLDAYKKNRLHHSLIFAGPTGVGKKTLAMHFIRNVLKNDIKIDSKSHPHVLFIEPIYDEKKQKFKRDITLDSLAGLNNFLHLSPTVDAPRFIVINPADGMNIPTQNTLLKTLEEPPENTFFILLTTQVAALLTTIRSRCLVVPVRPLDRLEFTRAMQYFLPDADINNVTSYQEMSKGSIGQALQYEQEKIMMHYDHLCQACVEWQKEGNSLLAMQIAETMATVDMSETTTVLIELFLDRMAQVIKTKVSGQMMNFITDSEQELFLKWSNLPPSKLLQDHERLQRLWQEGVTAYLDRKVVLLSFLKVVSTLDSVKAAVV